MKSLWKLLLQPFFLSVCTRREMFLPVTANRGCRPLQTQLIHLWQEDLGTIPSAVLYSDESKITCIDDRVILGTVRLADL